MLLNGTDEHFDRRLSLHYGFQISCFRFRIPAQVLDRTGLVSWLIGWGGVGINHDSYAGWNEKSFGIACERSRHISTAAAFSFPKFRSPRYHALQIEAR